MHADRNMGKLIIAAVHFFPAPSGHPPAARIQKSKLRILLIVEKLVDLEMGGLCG